MALYPGLENGFRRDYPCFHQSFTGFHEVRIIIKFSARILGFQRLSV